MTIIERPEDLKEKQQELPSRIAELENEVENLREKLAEPEEEIEGWKRVAGESNKKFFIQNELKHTLNLIDDYRQELRVIDKKLEISEKYWGIVDAWADMNFETSEESREYLENRLREAGLEEFII